jgi:hypothetical protein
MRTWTLLRGAMCQRRGIIYFMEQWGLSAEKVLVTSVRVLPAAHRGVYPRW